MTWSMIAVLFGAIALFAFALTARAKQLTGAQSALLGIALFAALLAVLPRGKLSVAGSSFEPEVQAATVDVSKQTSAQIDALSQRINALDAKLDLMVTKNANAGQKAAVERAGEQAQQRYKAASQKAAQARQTLQRVGGANPFVPCKPILSVEGQPILTESGQALCAD